MPEIKQHLPRGRPLSPLSLKIMALLEDGEWHEFNSVVEQAMLVIPPGEAYRVAEKARIHARRDKDDPAPTRKRNTEYGEIVAIGQRAKTTQTIHSMHDNGRIERKEEDGKKYLRLIRATPRIIYLIDEKGKRSLHYPSNHVLITEIDMRDMANASTMELESKLMELSTFPERFPKVMELRKELQRMIQEKKINGMLVDYDR